MILPICWVPASLLSAISCAYCGPAIWYGPGGMAKIFLCAGRRPRRCHHFNGAGAYPAHERRKGQWLIINMKAPAAANRQIRNRSQKIASPTDILMSTAGVNITMTMRTTTAMDITTRAAPAALDHDISFETCGEDGCGHDHSHTEEKSAWLSIIAAAVLAAFSFLPVPDAASHLMLAAAAVIAGFPLFWSGIKSIIRLRLDETALLLIAVVAAMALGEFWEGALVTILFRLGNQLEGWPSPAQKEHCRSDKNSARNSKPAAKKWKLSRNCCCFHSHRIPNFD